MFLNGLFSLKYFKIVEIDIIWSNFTGMMRAIRLADRIWWIHGVITQKDSLDPIQQTLERQFNGFNKYCHNTTPEFSN